MYNMQQLSSLLNEHHKTYLNRDDSNYPLVTPIHKSIKYSYESLEEFEKLIKGKIPGFIYAKANHPNAEQLANLLTKITKKEASLVFSSGIGAITATLTGLLEKGNQLIAFRECYTPTKNFIKEELGYRGINTQFFYTDEFDLLEKQLETQKIDWIIFESPTNPQMRTLDLVRLQEICQKHNVKTIIDNTFNGFHNLDTDQFDVVIHSLTKYATGHGDILGGSVSADKISIRKIRKVQLWMGNILSAQDCFQTMQYFKTYPLRYQRALENAEAIAPWLETQEKVEKVHYPGIQRTLRSDRGCILSFVVKTEIRPLLEALKMIPISASVGSTETLIAPCRAFYSMGTPDKELDRAGISSRMLRLSLGIENIQDIKNDLQRGLDALC